MKGPRKKIPIRGIKRGGHIVVEFKVVGNFPKEKIYHYKWITKVQKLWELRKIQKATRHHQTNILLNRPNVGSAQL